MTRGNVLALAAILPIVAACGGSGGSEGGGGSAAGTDLTPRALYSIRSPDESPDIRRMTLTEFGLYAEETSPDAETLTDAADYAAIASVAIEPTSVTREVIPYDGKRQDFLPATPVDQYGNVVYPGSSTVRYGDDFEGTGVGEIRVNRSGDVETAAWDFGGVEINGAARNEITMRGGFVTRSYAYDATVYRWSGGREVDVYTTDGEKALIIDPVSGEEVVETAIVQGDHIHVERSPILIGIGRDMEVGDDRFRGDSSAAMQARADDYARRGLRGYENYHGPNISVHFDRLTSGQRFPDGNAPLWVESPSWEYRFGDRDNAGERDFHFSHEGLIPGGEALYVGIDATNQAAGQ